MMTTASGTADSFPVPPLGTGPPTKEQLIAYYSPLFTFDQLKTFINSGDLGLLKRDKRLQQRYDLWIEGIKKEYGSSIGYLLNYRLQWGKPDTLSLLHSALDADSYIGSDLESPPAEYFTVDIPRSFLSIILNDWPYSVPIDIEHSLIWTRLPIFHPDLVAEQIAARIHQDGLCGFTGLDGPPPSPSLLPLFLPALADWGITMETMILSPRCSLEEEELIANAGTHVHQFVQRRWKEAEWETAWFVNPPRLQSIPGLGHVHVFARKKNRDVSNI